MQVDSKVGEQVVTRKQMHVDGSMQAGKASGLLLAMIYMYIN